MKLSTAQKTNLLDAATQVYKGYVALDFFKNRSFQVGSQQLTLQQICDNAIQSAQLKQNLTINGQVFELELSKDPAHSYKMSCKRPLTTFAGSPRQPINDYNDADALALLAQQNFYINIDDKAQSHVLIKLNEKTIIGGIGKFDLYRSHLVTLHNIIEKISAEEDISSLLVALATGSGKTYVQALWILVLSLSGNHGIFAVPDKLVTQLRNDLRRVLPNNLVDELLVLRENEENPAVEQALNDLKTTATKPRIIIGSSERLLDKHYQELLEASTERTFLSFDEQHLLMKSERRRVRLIELSKQMLAMFLTATPNQETYHLSGNKPVAIMSSGQKQAAGQGQFPVLFSENARNISDRNQLRHYRFWTSEFWMSIFRGFLLRFSSAIQQEQSSAAVSIVENLPFYFFRKPDEDDVRWSMQVPMARKMLCIIDDNETLVNFCHALDTSDSHDRNVYHNGNMVDRRAISDFFRIPDVDYDLIQDDLRHKQSQYRKKLNENERNIGQSLAGNSLKTQLKHNIFHNMLEFVLTDLTGFDEIEHNRLRKRDPQGFQTLIRNKLAVRSVEYYQQKLARQIDPSGAQQIAGILNQMSIELGRMHRREARYTTNDFNAFVDNWALDANIINTMQHANYDLEQQFSNYVSRHLMMSVMTGMQSSETPIEESRPFSGLTESRYSMYHNGILSHNAKRRQHTSLETLNDTSQESSFAPNYQDFNEEICDNYFRLGFVGVYVSNKKTEGFSDRNLHTVINIAENTLSATNSPDTLIQGIGRNRGLDDTIVPAYIHALGREQGNVFNLENLKSNDYYPELFKSQKSYNQQFIQVLGNNVGQEIIQWFRSNVDTDETINDDQLKKQVLKIIAKSLRQLNNNNSHNMQLSRSQLTKVVSEAMSALDEEIARTNKPYELTVSIRIIGSILNFICEIYYSLQTMVPAWQRFKHSWFGPRTPLDAKAISAKHPDDVYIKIINHTDFKTLIANASVAREFRDWLTRKGTGIETIARKNGEFYLKDYLKDQLRAHKEAFLGPLLGKFVVPAKRNALLNTIKNMPNIIGFLEKNQDAVLAIADINNTVAPEQILRLLKEIPGFHDLTLADVINYPEQVKADLALLEKGPFALLTENNVLRNDTINSVADYLKGPFLVQASAFFVDGDLKVLKKTLQHEDNATKFLAHLFTKTKDSTFQLNDLNRVITELQQFFKLDDFGSLEFRAAECMKLFVNEMDGIDENPLLNLKDEEITTLAKIIKDELLPCLVNVYPLANRQALLDEASLAKVKELLKKEGSVLMRCTSGNPIEIATSIFSKLSSSPLPSPLNVVNEASRLQKTLEQQFTAVLNQSYVGLGVKKIFNPFSWSGTLDKPEYLYDLSVVTIIKGTDFIEGMSLMLSFNEWSDLNAKIKNDSAGTLKLARALIDSQMQGAENNLQPEKLIQLINQSYATHYIGTEASADKALKKLEEQHTRLNLIAKEDPISLLTPEAITRIARMIREKLSPVLAAFIQESEVREHFLKQLPSDDKELVEFVFFNKIEFEQLQTSNADKAKNSALDLINQLLPAEEELQIEQIIFPLEHAEEKSEQVIADLSETMVSSVLTSDFFSKFAEKLFNHQDYSKLFLFLQNKAKVAALAKKIVTAGIETVTQDKLIALLQEDELLKDIQTFDRRMTSFTDFVKGIINGGFTGLDNKKLSSLIADELAPVFFHPEFYNSLSTLVAFLNEEDCTVLLQAMGKSEPKKHAATIMQFLNSVKARDKEALLKSDAFHDADSIKATVELLGQLIEEVIDCQCYYNQHDTKGEQGRGTYPKLHDKLSAELREIRVDADYSFLSGFSRKVFFIQAIRNGLPRCAAVNGDSNQSQVKHLERVKTHILRPLWWSTNMSNVGYALVKTGRNVTLALRASGFAILNAFKTVLNFVRAGKFTISARNPISADYNETAFAMAKTINELTPFDAPKVAVKECLIDTVTGFENCIAARRSPQFFPPVAPVNEEKPCGGIQPQAQ